MESDGDLWAMIGESATATLMGVLSVASWLYASRGRRLLNPGVTEEDVRLLIRFLPKPVIAALTIPCAFLGIELWTLSWIVIGSIVPRLAARRTRAA